MEEVGAVTGSAERPELDVLTEEDYEKAKVDLPKPLLLQLGSAACERCPAFHDAIAALKETHQFKWVYCDAHHQDADLPEFFSVARLPAFVLYNPGTEQPLVVANASPEQLHDAVSKTCTPVFTLDADF